MDGHHPNQTDVESVLTWIPANDVTGEWWQVKIYDHSMLYSENDKDGGDDDGNDVDDEK